MLNHSQEWDNYATIYEEKQLSGSDDNKIKKSPTTKSGSFLFKAI